MKTLKFYRVTDWMLAIGEGFTPCTGLLALIHSFNVNGKECEASTAYFAKFCGCSRRKIFSELEYLVKNGYVTANKRSRTAIVGYTVNVEKCIEAAQAYARDAQALMQEMHKPYAQDAYAYAGDAQALMHEVHTNNRNKNTRIKNDKEKREGENPPAKNRESVFISIQGFDGIRLTESEYDYLRYQIDYAPTKGKSLDTYMSKAIQYRPHGKESHFDYIRSMATSDGAKVLTDADALKNKENAEYLQSAIKEITVCGDEWDCEKPF